MGAAKFPALMIILLFFFISFSCFSESFAVLFLVRVFDTGDFFDGFLYLIEIPDFLQLLFVKGGSFVAYLCIIVDFTFVSFPKFCLLAAAKRSVRTGL